MTQNYRVIKTAEKNLEKKYNKIKTVEKSLEANCEKNIANLENRYSKLQSDHDTIRARNGQFLRALKFIRNIPGDAEDAVNLQTNIASAVTKALNEPNVLSTDPLDGWNREVIFEVWEALIFDYDTETLTAPNGNKYACKVYTQDGKVFALAKEGPWKYIEKRVSYTANPDA
ncbi:hypothetical protein N0V85_008860 [Neurospora sp. IMI 360204]|nr:hypothetical protein N0V85_008860 [Neurospora sp. IMI 360204]